MAVEAAIGEHEHVAVELGHQLGREGLFVGCGRTQACPHDRVSTALAQTYDAHLGERPVVHPAELFAVLWGVWHLKDHSIYCHHSQPGEARTGNTRPAHRCRDPFVQPFQRHFPEPGPSLRNRARSRHFPGLFPVPQKLQPGH